MCNFNKQDEDTKALIHLVMDKAAKNVGGANFLLSLIEAMKTKRPNPLMSKERQISSNNTIIKWNKVVFKDKVDVLEELLVENKQTFKLEEIQNLKKRKATFNMIKTLSPIEFTVMPQNPNDGSGFNFKAFENVEDNNVTINPIFVAMFFCSTEYTKKALKYEI